jgi:hypothetical protein
MKKLRNGVDRAPQERAGWNAVLLCQGRQGKQTCGERRAY